MKQHRKFVAYVRLANGREKSESLRTAIRLAFYQQLGKPYYVMVQRGSPNVAIEAGRSKRDVTMSPIVMRLRSHHGKARFRKWANSFRSFGYLTPKSFRSTKRRS